MPKNVQMHILCTVHLSDVFQTKLSQIIYFDDTISPILVDICTLKMLVVVVVIVVIIIIIMHDYYYDYD